MQSIPAEKSPRDRLKNSAVLYSCTFFMFYYLSTTQKRSSPCFKPVVLQAHWPSCATIAGFNFYWCHQPEDHGF